MMNRILKLIVMSILVSGPQFLVAQETTHPFNYDLHLFTIPGKTSRTMILFHGYGSNYKIAEQVKRVDGITDTLVSFNFPEYDLPIRKKEILNFSFGSFEELRPAFYVLKKIVIDENRDVIDLYGYSAGGGVLVNVLGTLNSSLYDSELQKMGIDQKGKRNLLDAIQKGMIILDVPLKSIEEIISFIGSSLELELLANRYRENQLIPIESLDRLKGLKLDIILFFQDPDEVLYNRDDALYIERLKRANDLGNTVVIIHNDGSHTEIHKSLWNYFLENKQ
jgi:hypothetical protein